MNDNLDKTLEAWKEQRTPKDAQFASEEKFAADFFEKAAQLPSEKIAKKTFWPIVCKLAACLVVVICLAVILLKQNRKKEIEVARNVLMPQTVQYETVDAIKEQTDGAVEITPPQAPEVKAIVPQKVDSKPVAKQSRREEQLETFKVIEAMKEQNLPLMLFV